MMHIISRAFGGAALLEHLHTASNSLALVMPFRDAAKWPRAKLMLAFSCTEGAGWTPQVHKQMPACFVLKCFIEAGEAKSEA